MQTSLLRPNSIFTQKFIIQKLDYIHWNPCTGKWELADCPENYIHSSAGLYPKGIRGVLPVDDIMLMMDIDLSKGNLSI